MKSLMVDQAYVPKEDKGKYSDLQVLRSHAGWYIGTVFTEDGFSEPGSRDSNYFRTEQEAKDELDQWEKDGGSPNMRTNP